MGYYKELLKKAGFVGDTLTLRDCIEQTVQEPTAEKIRTASAALAGGLHKLLDEEQQQLGKDLLAILCVEREWLEEN